jgi:hypothetical protein
MVLLVVKSSLLHELGFLLICKGVEVLLIREVLPESQEIRITQDDLQQKSWLMHGFGTVIKCCSCRSLMSTVMLGRSWSKIGEILFIRC